HEEREVFPRLREYCDAEQRSTMADRFDTAKKTGPTPPHPQAPNRPPGLLALGPVASIFDRARDAARNAMGS
ncbi:MAG: hemerythrin domain-containing protein, partial [Actinomycetota bacterium]|nr:hemerythrin domain-containing protein [Actinomycetota bacterium]